MSYELNIKIHDLPKTVNAWRGKHWSHRMGQDKKWKKLVREAIGESKPAAPLKRALVSCLRASASAPDYDGLVSSFKPVIDGLVECGVLEDDSMSHIGIPNFYWRKAPPKQGYVSVFVREP